jgi:hypothetical protein
MIRPNSAIVLPARRVPRLTSPPPASLFVPLPLLLVLYQPFSFELFLLPQDDVFAEFQAAPVLESDAAEFHRLEERDQHFLLQLRLSHFSYLLTGECHGGHPSFGIENRVADNKK